MVLAAWVPTLAIMETLNSFSSAIWISCLGLAFGTLQIVVPRLQTRQYLEDREDEWGFGQLVPLILLVLPLSPLWEHLVVEQKAEDIEVQPDQVAGVRAQAPATQTEEPRLPHAVLRDQSALLLHHFAAQHPINMAQPSQSRATVVEQILVGCWIFHINVYLLQPTIIVGSVIIFYNDSLTIGYNATGNWFPVCFVFVAYLATAWIVTFILAPWSRTGKRDSESNRSVSAYV